MNFRILLICFLFGTRSVWAQHSFVYQGELINQTNEQNQKTGKWIYFISEDTAYLPVIWGQYDNGKRCGLWTYYAYKSDYGPSKKVFYNKNGDQEFISTQGWDIMCLPFDSSTITFYRTVWKNPIRAVCFRNGDGTFDCREFDRYHRAIANYQKIDFENVKDKIGNWDWQFFTDDESYYGFKF
jgi:hypothetical protein